MLVVYDVGCDRLRRRVARLLGGYGERVQRSAFECRLRRGERRELERRLRALLPAGAGPPVGEGELPGCSVRLYVVDGPAVELGRGLTPAAQEVVVA